ncbi:apolipo protein O-domain-containing protein [Butyriboletus roseoflavus]|nr:apolipo protein O-domain-containing protein [Butyriboletus roseoflavus]
MNSCDLLHMCSIRDMPEKFPRFSPVLCGSTSTARASSTTAVPSNSYNMFRRHAFRASRRAYVTSAGAVGTIVAETSQSEDQSTPTDVVPDALAKGANSEANYVPIVVEPEPTPPKTVFADLSEKPSIYPNPPPTLVLLDTPSPLELRIGQVRREVCGYYSGARTRVQGVIDRWIHVEQAVESRLKSFRDPAEPLNPGLLYTGVSTLTASVVVRSRSLPVRFVLPSISLIGAFAYFLPRTAGRVGGWVEELEGRYAPRVGEIRRTGVAHTSMTFSMLGERYREGKEGLGKGAMSVVEGIESSTGLRLSGALGWARAGDDKKSGSEENKSA